MTQIVALLNPMIKSKPSKLTNSLLLKPSGNLVPGSSLVTQLHLLRFVDRGMGNVGVGLLHLEQMARIEPASGGRGGRGRSDRGLVRTGRLRVRAGTVNINMNRPGFLLVFLHTRTM